jgi:hypothetical protein
MPSPPITSQTQQTGPQIPQQENTTGRPRGRPQLPSCYHCRNQSCYLGHHYTQCSGRSSRWRSGPGWTLRWILSGPKLRKGGPRDSWQHKCCPCSFRHIGCPILCKGSMAGSSYIRICWAACCCRRGSHRSEYPIKFRSVCNSWGEGSLLGLSK